MEELTEYIDFHVQYVINVLKRFFMNKNIK